MDEVWARLREPFPAEHIEWRIGRSGVKNGKPWAMVLAYVTNRAIMDRLDEVVGPDNWWNEYQKAPVADGMMCGLSICLPDGRIVTKWDGAEKTDVEPLKGCISGAMKRAAVLLGIGRYLYDLEEGFANIHEGGRFRGAAKDPADPKKRITFKWDPPPLPEWALPPKRENKTDRERDALLKWIRTQYDAAPEEMEIRIDGGISPMKAYVRGVAEEMKGNYALARLVADAISETTGERFTPPA